MLIAALAAAACGFTYSPPPVWDRLPFPDGAVVLEVPAAQIDTLCAATPHVKAGTRQGCHVGLTAYIPTWKTWRGTRECWAENRRHEEAHLKGWTHP